MVFFASKPKDHQLNMLANNGKIWRKTNDANNWIWLTHLDTIKRSIMDFCKRCLVLFQRLVPRLIACHAPKSANGQINTVNNFDSINNENMKSFLIYLRNKITIFRNSASLFAWFSPRSHAAVIIAFIATSTGTISAGKSELQCMERTTPKAKQSKTKQNIKYS